MQPVCIIYTLHIELNGDALGIKMSVTCNSSTVIKRISRMMVITLNSAVDEINPAFAYKLIVNYLMEVFMDVGEHIIIERENNYLIYFPNVIIDTDPLYDTILNDIASIFKRNSIHIKRDAICFDSNPEPISEEDRIIESTDSNIEITSENIRGAEELCPSTNNLFSKVDEFQMMLLYCKQIHEQNPTFIYEIILYLTSAYYWSEKQKSYNRREELFVNRENWITTMRDFGVADEVSAKYFDEAKKYAYTTLTVKEIICRHSSTMRIAMNKYSQGRIKQKIRNLFNFTRFPNDPSDNDLWMAVSEYLREDHFFADNKIYVMDENYCRTTIPTEMRGVINMFIALIKEVKYSLKYEYSETNRSADIEKLNERERRIIKPFESRISSKFIADAIENYLNTKLRNEVMAKAIAFEDIVVIYDQGKIYKRKAFMEDQFIGCAGVPIMHFGRLANERSAMSEVRNALRQIFVYDAEVKWFLKWCGSLLAHKPERCVLVMYGKKGGNAKTTLANVLLKIFGAWGVQCRPDMLAPSGKSSSCTPFEMELLYKVLAIFSEPQKGIKYSSSSLKELSGGDRKKGAAKYKDPVEFDQTAKPMILCNEIPEFDVIDLALLDRMYILNCIGRYMHNATPEDAVNHIYPRDDTFWSDMTRVRAFAHLITHEGLDMYMEEGLKKTENMEKMVRNWHKEMCPFARYLDGKSKLFEGKETYSCCRQVFADFKRCNTTLSMQFSEFIERFKDATGISPTEIEGSIYYPFYLKGCTDCKSVVIKSAGDDNK